jgi:hypothetical protein
MMPVINNNINPMPIVEKAIPESKKDNSQPVKQNASPLISI